MDKEHIFYLLESKFPLLDSILIGCHADSEIVSHECCEYDLVLLQVNNTLHHQDLAYKQKFHVFRDQSRVYEVLILSIQEFTKNPNINYTNFVQFPCRALRSSIVNYFVEKRNRYRESFALTLKANIIRNIFGITHLHNLLSREVVDEKFVSFQLKMISLKTLKLFIQFYLNIEDRPSHLKYQINQVKQKEKLKVREHIDLLLEYIGTNRANISTLSRSERSLRFLIRREDSLRNNIFLDKLDFFKEKSMYVDGFLLIGNFILNKGYDSQFIQKYNKLLNLITDIQTEEKITMLKEVNLLLEINKNLI